LNRRDAAAIGQRDPDVVDERFDVHCGYGVP
jgi:hypothetical protein